MPASVGLKFGRYELRRRVARGDVTEVFLAREPEGEGIEGVTVRLYDTDPRATRKTMRNLEGAGLTLVPCLSGEESMEGAMEDSMEETAEDAMEDKSAMADDAG